MKRYVVRVSTDARVAIQAHVDYVAKELRSPENADRWLLRLLRAIESLEEMPTRFARNEIESTSIGVAVYRLTFERSCVLSYVVDEDEAQVRVLSFQYGGRP